MSRYWSSHPCQCIWMLKNLSSRDNHAHRTGCCRINFLVIEVMSIEINLYLGGASFLSRCHSQILTLKVNNPMFKNTKNKVRTLNLGSCWRFAPKSVVMQKSRKKNNKESKQITKEECHEEYTWNKIEDWDFESRSLNHENEVQWLELSPC